MHGHFPLLAVTLGAPLLIRQIARECGRSKKGKSTEQVGLDFRYELQFTYSSPLL